MSDQARYEASASSDSSELILKAINAKSAAKVEDWIRLNFPENCEKPFAPFHRRVFEWTDRIILGKYQASLVECWARGQAKSTTLQSILCFIAEHGLRKFALYVSETSDRAQYHLRELASSLTKLNLEEEVDLNGKRVAWNRKQLRIKNFVVVAVGLNEAVRGIKIRGQRPDMILMDDIDGDHDTQEIRAKKVSDITSKILPAGSTDCIVCFLQNLICKDSIMSTMVDGSAEFLTDRNEVEVVPAIYDATFEPAVLPSGRGYMKITGGTPAWVGMGLDVCQQFILKFGFEAFERECQHNVTQADGYFFNVEKWSDESPFCRLIDRKDVPTFEAVCMAWDLAATEGAGDYTVGAVIGVVGGTFYVDHVVRGQWSPDNVEKKILDYADLLHRRFPGKYVIRIPIDPAQAGRYQVNALGRKLAGKMVRFEAPRGSKGERARLYASDVNVGNVYLVRAPWNQAFIHEHKNFRDVPKPKPSPDQVDAAGDAYSQLSLRLNADQFSHWTEEDDGQYELATTETDPGPPSPWEIMQREKMLRLQESGPVAVAFAGDWE